MPKSFPATEVAAAVGTPPAGWTRIESGGYGRVNAHWRVELPDGRSAFVKHALTEQAAQWLRTERGVLESVNESFVPALFGSYDSSDCTLLVIEDLGDGDWPPPWSSERIEAVLATLDKVHATTPPNGLPRLEQMREHVVGWPKVAADPEPMLSTGVCTSEWLEVALPTLLEAVHNAQLDGDSLLHLDVRSDNLCFLGERVVLVDWNLACVGNAQFDAAFWLPSVRLEDGPEPDEILPPAGELAAVVAGFFAARAGLPPPAGAPTVRDFQRQQLSVALPWAARELGLDPPTLPA